jgi:hypothetical protein
MEGGVVTERGNSIVSLTSWIVMAKCENCYLMEEALALQLIPDLFCF